MAMRGGPRLQSEIEEFSFSARNEMDWLNEHMAEIFSENQMNVAELFKTPGKLRGKTPRTGRKADRTNLRVPLFNMFSATPKGAPNPFAMSNPAHPRSPKIQIPEDKIEPAASHHESSAMPAVVRPPHQVEPRAAVSLADSGYHGSQSQDTMPFDHFDKDVEMSDSPHRDLHTSDPVLPVPSEPEVPRSPSVVSADETFESADENQTRQATASVMANAAPSPSSAMVQPSSPFASRTRLPVMSPRSPSPGKSSSPARHLRQQSSSPLRSTSPQKPSSPQMTRLASPQKGFPKPTEELRDAGAQWDDEADDAAEDDEMRSASDASSPVRRVVRKSSLNFASLPAREPLASKKSLGGARVSRTSHLDFSRPSYFNRQNGGKSLGNTGRQDSSDDEQDDHDRMDIDDEAPKPKEDAIAPGKTYTQQLQDQISMLGKAQASGTRSSKSLANTAPSQQSVPALKPQSQAGPTPEARKPSPKPKHSVPAPGAFPEDDDDDDDEWIAPPKTIAAPTGAKITPAPARPISQPSGVLDSLPAKSTSNGSESVLSSGKPTSPRKLPFMPERTPKHGKSVSVPVLPTLAQLDAEAEDAALKKTISVSNSALTAVAEDDLASSPPKSPTRSNNPLKQVITSLFKGTKGLIASSAAISAEGKSSLLRSPYHAGASVESFKTAENVMYPDLSQHIAVTAAPLSPVRSKDTKHEAKEREKEKKKEMKDAKVLAEQMRKLEKAQEKESEKARVFSKEQEKIAAMEKQVAAAAAARKEQEKVAQAPAQAFRTPGPPSRNGFRSPTKTTKPTPHMTKGQDRSDEVDTDMTDVTTAIPPPSIPRPATASSMRALGTKRPMKPTKEAVAKPKQAPTMIKVTTNSKQTFNPSTSVLASTLQDTLGQAPGSARQVNGKASQNSLHGKGSVNSFKSSSSSTGRPKALDTAAKLKDQEARKRDAKLETDRKRAAQEEERRQEEQRKEEERKWKADIEKAKQTKAPPPAVRPQPNGPPAYSMADKGPARPPSRLGSIMDGRLVNTALPSAKGPSKRPLEQDAGEESSRAQQPRGLASQPAKEAKRMRRSDEADEDADMMEAHSQPIIKAPPMRPSNGFRKELPQPKSTYGNAYSNAPPPPPSASRNLFKDTVTAQHNSHSKAGHHLDTAQFSTGKIPFAPNQGAHKTPARPVGGAIGKVSAAKSAARSPRYQNGEMIELPDIQTDDESDEDDGHMAVAPWADSPALKAALLAQERVDPMQVFGPPAPLIMEEVFSKTKDRFHKFRARTSSANWSGADRLTEEDVRKDLAARDKMRREGGWSYELSRDMA